MRTCSCGNVVAENAKSCSICGEQFESTATSTMGPVILWSVVTFVVAVVVGIVLQGF